MMDTCAARRGFLTMRDCGEAANQLCNTCQRPMCTEHLSSASGYQQCLDCFTKGDQAKTTENVDESDPTWARRYQRDYYASSGYHAIYYGRSNDDYYDDLDVRSFDDDVNAGALDDDDGGERAGFADS
jgi:hypothetical protein